MSSTAPDNVHHVLAISIGPVQDFISASRKARDLWSGSDMLSKLSWTAAKSLHDTQTVDLIFPASLEQDGKQPNCANKLLAHVRQGDPATLAANAKLAVENRLNSSLRNVVPSNITQFIDMQLAEQQTAGFIEWYAAWLPFDPAADPASPASYANRRVEVERLLAGRKALRDFLPAQGIDGRPKSSLDPSRESVIRHDLIRQEDRTRQFTVSRTLRLKGTEQLDGVSLLKRLEGQQRLVSVSRVAVDPFIRRCVQERMEDDLERLREAASRLSDTDLAEHFATTGGNLDHYKEFPYDCQLFYAQSVRDASPEELDQAQIEAVERFLNTSQRLARTLHSPPTYFAVLVADGDRMGKALGELQTPKAHQAFATELSRFATSAAKTVQDHFGAMIYSGGDDVLAFLPLDTALPCAHVLKHDFAETIERMWQSLRQLGITPPDARPTLSVGLAVGHYAEHLQVLLGRGRDAEKAAKTIRNALAVSFSAHSGGGDPRTVKHSWNIDPVRTRWWFAINALRLDAIPDGSIYELGELCRELDAVHTSLPATANDLVYREVLRVIGRKRTRGGAEKVAGWVQDELQRRLSTATPAEQLSELRMIVDELYIARKFLPAIVLGDKTALDRWTDQTRGPGAVLVAERPDSEREKGTQP